MPQNTDGRWVVDEFDHVRWTQLDSERVLDGNHQLEVSHGIPLA
jgi:hypothetical protein